MSLPLQPDSPHGDEEGTTAPNASQTQTDLADAIHAAIRRTQGSNGAHARSAQARATARASSGTPGAISLTHAASIGLPQFADSCEVWLRGSDNLLVQAAAAHADPVWTAPAAKIRLRGVPPRTHGTVALLPWIADDRLEFFARTNEELQQLRAIAPRSAVIIPLEADGVEAGRVIWFHRTSARRFSESDLPTFRALAGSLALYVHEVAMRRATRDQLVTRQRADQRLRFVLEGARVGTWEWDIAHGGVHWSSALEGMHGMSVGAFGGTFDDWMHAVEPRDRGALFAALRGALDGSDVFACEYRQRRDDGTTVWLEDRGRVERDDNGAAVRVVGVCTDVTSRRASQMQDIMASLARAERMATVGQMTASILHEVGNPLAAIKTRIQSSLEVCREAEHTGEWFGEVLQRLLVDVDRLATFLHSFRRLARDEVPDRHLVDPLVVLDEVASLMVPQLRRRSIRLEVDPMSGGPPFRADASLIRHVLVNLVLNAADASPEGGEIRLHSRVAGAHDSLVQLIVTDRGKGIPAADLDRVFEPFFTTTPGGMGLGLAICQRIVASHNGRIQVQSSPGRGTTFTITFPV
ncbi:MAG: nitrogen regulation protein NR(II) [Planctomycetota bacterium]